MAARAEGGCLCGAIRYRVPVSPESVADCHCRLCRRASGAPHVPWATYRSAEFEIVRGEPVRYRSSERAERTFCGRCGTPLTFQLHARSAEIDVTVCSHDRPEALAPQYHIWTRRRLPWVGAGGLPEYAGERDAEG